MDLRELTEKLVKSIVSNKDDVSVKEFPSEDENSVVLEVLVKEEDMGRLIGKGGKTINAVRTLVQASSSLHENKYVRINTDKF